jgi:hypothetical protein
MSLINGKADKGLTGNSGNASGGGWTLTGTAGPKKAAAIRKEWTAPRNGDLAHRASTRPKQ